MKKIIVSVFIVGLIAIICLLINIIFFKKNIPTGDQNGVILTHYSSTDMLGNWDISVTQKSDNLLINSMGIMNISSYAGNYFYGTITINDKKINNEIINGGTVEVEGFIYNNIVTIYFDYNEEYLNIKYDAKFTPKILNDRIVLNLDTFVNEENMENEYIFNLIKKEVYKNEK